jgi:hypothetical protein
MRTLKLYAAVMVDGARDSDFVPIETTLLFDIDMVHFKNLETLGLSARSGVADVRLFDRPEDDARQLMAIRGNEVVLIEGDTA